MPSAMKPLVCILLIAVATTEAHEVMFELHQGCEKLYVDVDKHSQVDVRSFNNSAHYSVSADTSCLAFFKTSLPGHGLCVKMQSLMLYSENVRLEFQTGPVTSDKIFQGRTNLSKEKPYKQNWCVRERVMAVRISSRAFEQKVENAALYSFYVTNKSLDSISRDFYMDSFSECGQTFTLNPGQEVNLISERNPHVTPDLPQLCQLTFKTSSEDEFEQVCLKLEMFTVNPKPLLEGGKGKGKNGGKIDLKQSVEDAKILQIGGLDSRFYTTYQALGFVMVCSEQKELTLLLNRTLDAKTYFDGKLFSRWHPYWETEATEARELAGLRVVKGITYFIATIDSLIAIVVAAIAAVLKRPNGPWKHWIENVSTHTTTHTSQTYPPAGQTDNGSSYGSMHACKDGNYPELPTEGATHTSEVYVESHTY